MLVPIPPFSLQLLHLVWLLQPCQGTSPLEEGCGVVLLSGGCLVESCFLSGLLLLPLDTSPLGEGWLFSQSILQGLWVKQGVLGI